MKSDRLTAPPPLAAVSVVRLRDEQDDLRAWMEGSRAQAQPQTASADPAGRAGELPGREQD